LSQVENHLELDHHREMGRDVRDGMTSPQKFIPSKYLYDARGSWLFEKICCVPEYYPTRTEMSILDQRGEDVMGFFDDGEGDLVELGSGANWKIRRLLGALDSKQVRRVRYVPVDISEACLEEACEDLLDHYEGLNVLGIVADFTRHMDVIPDGKKLILFLGSTIGNFTEAESVTLLRNVGENMGPEDRLLLGMDMVKPRKVLEQAYNDSEGFTRRFNLNILSHLNQRLRADFQPEDFEHLAFFNEAESRIEMHLRARRDHTIHIHDLSLEVPFQKGETIHTESSRKYTRGAATECFKQAGLTVDEWYGDPKGWFSLIQLKA
jgi:L-histidine N-alpha-methyltransferase